MKIKLGLKNTKLWFYFLLVCHLCVSLEANSMILDKYAWTNRLVIVVTEKNKNKLEKDVRQFFELYRCDVDDRNLKLLSFFTDDPIVQMLPTSVQSQTGMWLIGYDGNIKAYSEDGQLLTKLFEIIDKMPMRKGEMKSGSGDCIK